MLSFHFKTWFYNDVVKICRAMLKKNEQGWAVVLSSSSLLSCSYNYYPRAHFPSFAEPLLSLHKRCPWSPPGLPVVYYQYTTGCQKIILHVVCPDFRAFSAVTAPERGCESTQPHTAVHLVCLHPQVGRTSFPWILNVQPCTQGIDTINPFKSCLHLIHNLFCYEGDFHKVRGVRRDLVLYSGWIHRL